jgi:ceramide glucosyltransferase
VLGVRDVRDSALTAARALMRDLPECDIALAVDARARGSNLKVANLENMVEAAKHEILVLADSDMRVDRRYLAAVTAPLRDPQNGIVTCLYKGVSTGGIWSELGAMHINFGFLPGALVAEALGLGGGCFGATIALRRETFERIGGFARLRDELADDHRIGEEVRALGLAVVLSPYVVEARVSEPSLAGLWRHELRWARTVRAMAPAGFAGSFLTHPVAIAALGALMTGFGLTSWIFVVISCALRWASARGIAAALGGPPAKPWLLPVRDALSLAVFIASFFGRTVFWRDQSFHLEASGRMTVDGGKTL